MGITRRTLVGAGLGSLSVGLAAGGTARGAEPVTLQFWEGHSLQEETATIRMIAAFEAANPGIKIARTKVAFGSDFEKITTAVAAGTVPDVCPIWSGFLTQFAAAGTLLDLTKYGANDVQKEVYPAAWSYTQWHSGTYGVPYALDPRFLAINKPALDEAGGKLPATLADIADLARAMTKRSGNNVDRYGFGLATQDDLMFAFINFAYANGGSVVNPEQTEATFNQPQSVEAGALIGRMVKEGTLAAGVPIDGLRHAVLSGRVAMMVDGPWIFYAASNFAEAQPIVIAPIPPGRSGGKPVNVGSVGAYVVFANSKHPDEAARFATYMATPAAQQFRVQLLKTGVSPGVADEPYAKETFAKWPELRQAQQIDGDAVILPITAKWGRVWDALLPAVQAIVSGADPKQSLDTAANQANRALRRA